MSEATIIRDADDLRVTVGAAVASGDVWQLKSGQAAVMVGTNGGTSGDQLKFQTDGQYTFPKTTSMVLLDGGRAYWDHSAAAVSFRKVNDRDFYLGRVVGDAASSDTVCAVNINVNPPDDISVLRDGCLSVATGTSAVGGFDLPRAYGGARSLQLTATNEAQCVDLLSVDSFAIGANAIVEAIFRLSANGSTSAVDFNVGIANGTSTTDADSITEHCLVHIDGGDLSLWAQSKDGTTTVAATDTTIDATAGAAVANRVEIWMDMRTESDVQIYVNGVLVLPSTVFDLSHAAGPLGILAHVEKTSSTATFGPIYIDRLSARFAEQ